MEFLLDLLSNGTWSLNFFSGSFGIIAYVLQALALYTIAKRRGLNKPWLAWIPVVNVWTLGAVSDQYQEVAKGKKTNRRKILLGLSIAEIVLAVLCLIVFVIALVAACSNPNEMLTDFENMIESSEDGSYLWLSELIYLLAGAWILLMLCLLPVMVLAVVLAVFRWMAVYDVFKSCDPKNTTVYFLVGLLGSIFAVSGLESVFMLVCMNKDEGMIPKQPEVQNEIES